MKTRGVSAAALVVLVALLIVGCSRDEGDAGAVGETAEQGYTDSREAASEVESVEVPPAAAARGLPVEEEPEGEDAPRIVLADLIYEWRLRPRPELLVEMTFENPNDLAGRARGYLVVVAASAAEGASSRTTYPKRASFEGEWPDDPTDGDRLILRKRETVEVAIPYELGDGGHFDKLRVIVYDEDGDLSIDLGYDLDVTGEPTGEKRPKHVLSL